MLARMLVGLGADLAQTVLMARDVVEESLKEAEELRRDSRQEELLAKKLARKEAEEQSQRELTLRLASYVCSAGAFRSSRPPPSLTLLRRLCSLDARSLSLNEQKELLQSAREAVKVRTSQQDSAARLAAPPTLRIPALGAERDGRRVYSLGSAGIWAESGPSGQRRGCAAKPLLLVQSPCPGGRKKEKPSEYGTLRLDCPALAQCLDASGKQESRLLRAVQQLQSKAGVKAANDASDEASEPLPSVQLESADDASAGASKPADAARGTKSAKGPAGGKKGANKKKMPAASSAPAHKRTRSAVQAEASDCLPRKVDDMMAS